MTEPLDEVPILNYAPPPRSGRPGAVGEMRFWRSMVGYCVLAVLLSLIFAIETNVGAPIYFSLIALGIAYFKTLIAMAQAAAPSLGITYAFAHVALALLLTPLCLAGIVLVPIKVEADLASKATESDATTVH